MIATLTGTLAVRGANRIVVETVGVGYEVLIPLSTYYRLPPTGERVALEIRQVVREDALTLYGFSTGTEKRAFDLLMSVQHIFPGFSLPQFDANAESILVFPLCLPSNKTAWKAKGRERWAPVRDDVPKFERQRGYLRRTPNGVT